MKCKGMAPGFCSHWWNNKCREATLALQNAEGRVERRALQKNLKTVIKYAKQDQADSYITATNIWEVAAWQHGCQSSHIPALVTGDGSLTYDHKEMAGLLSRHFFAEDNSIPINFHGNPPAQRTQGLYPFTQSELQDMLTLTKNNSAPGSLGIGWFLLKKAWPHMGPLLANIFTACVHLAHHLAHWKEAKVVVIPKPDKPNYSHAKVHHPISLIETMSKLMKKAVTKHMQHDIVAHKLIPTTQFGRRSHSSCLDAGITLIHNI